MLTVCKYPNLEVATSLNDLLGQHKMDVSDTSHLVISVRQLLVYSTNMTSRLFSGQLV